jgi:hypothetical protein
VSQQLVEEQRLKISSPEKVARVLEKAGQVGLPLLIRAMSKPSVAVKGRAKVSPGSIGMHGFKIGNISQPGLEHLSQHGGGGVQIEFSLSNAKLMFYSTIAHFSADHCTFTSPDYLLSIERRKSIRYPVVGSLRAFLKVRDWSPKIFDPGVPPFLGSAADMISLFRVSDVNQAGLSIEERFPAVCKVLDEPLKQYEVDLYLPMIRPIAAAVSLHWQRKSRNIVSELDGDNRIVTSYRFGLQFVNPSSELVSAVNSFVSIISQAEAI